MNTSKSLMQSIGYLVACTMLATPAFAETEPEKGKEKPKFEWRMLPVDKVCLPDMPVDEDIPFKVKDFSCSGEFAIDPCLRSGGTLGRIGTRPVCRVPVAERDLRRVEYRTPQGTVERRWEPPKGPNRIPPYIPDMFAEANFKAVAAPIEHGKGQMLDKGPRWPNKGIIKPVSDAPSGTPSNAAGDPCNKPGVQCDPRDSLPPAERKGPAATPKEPG